MNRFLVLSSLLFVWCANIAFAQEMGISRERALEIVQSFYNNQDVDYYWCNDYTEGWKFFVDEMPRANWAHNCATYTFSNTFDIIVDETPVKQILRMPPNESLTPLSMSTAIRSRGIHRPVILPYSYLEIDTIAAQKTYAVILSGGISPHSNHHRYWNDCSFIYQTLVKRYGIPSSHIKVIMSDGTDPGEDLSLGGGEYVSSPSDLDGDGIGDINCAATFENVKSVFQNLNDTLSKDDHLFVYVIDHGERYDDDTGSLIYLWNNEFLTDVALSSWLYPIVRKSVFVNVILGQCYSGGFIDDLEMVGCVVVSACGADESSYARPAEDDETRFDYDEFVYQWTSAINGMNPYGYIVLADADNNGKVSMLEAFNYAKTYDSYSNGSNQILTETPQYVSSPISIGEDLAFNQLPKAVDLYVCDDIEDSGKEPNCFARNFWQSPSIWARNDDDGIEDHQNPVYDEEDSEAFVHVKVHNRGRDNYEGGLKWLHINWSLASTASSVLSWKGEESYNTLPTGGYLSPVAIPAIASGDSCVVKVPWELPVEQMLLDSDSECQHLNLIARILETSNQEPYVPVLPNTYDIGGVNNYAQKNVAYIHRRRLVRSSKVFMRNIDNYEQTYSLELRPHALRDTVLFDKANVELTLSPLLLKSWQIGGCVGSGISYEPAGDSLKISLNSAYSKLKNIKMQANQLELLSLKFDFHTPSPMNVSFGVDLIQRNQFGDIVGGQTYIVEAPFAFVDGPIEITPIGPIGPPSDRIDGGIITLGANLDGTEQLSEWTDSHGNVLGKTGTISVIPTPANNTYSLRVLTSDGELYRENITLEPTLGIKSITKSLEHANVLVVEFYGETFAHDGYVVLLSIREALPPIQYSIPVGVNSIQLDTANLPNGVYSLLYVVDGEMINAVKFSK